MIYFECSKKISEVRGNFGFEVSRPTLTPIGKPPLCKPTRSRSYAHHSELVSVLYVSIDRLIVVKFCFDLVFTSYIASQLVLSILIYAVGLASANVISY